MPFLSTPGMTLSSETAQAATGSVAAAARLLGLDSRLLAAFVVSRVIVLLAALVADLNASVLAWGSIGPAGPVLSSLTRWDGYFYLSIATDGYIAAPIAGEYTNVAFPPLYPLIVGVVSLPFPGFEGLIAVLVSNVAFLIGLGLLVRLGTPYLGRDRAVLAAALLTIYPFAWFFAMAYSESLFLVLMVSAFLCAEHKQRAATGVLLALAVLCRLQGIVLLIPLAVLMLRQDAWRPRPSLAWLLLGPAALAGFLLYVGWLTGDVAGFAQAQQAWGRSGIGSADPSEVIAADFSLYQAALLLTLLWSVFLLVFVRADRMRAEYWLVPVLFVSVAVLSGSLESIGRYATLAFPYVWILANRRSLIARRLWPSFSLTAFAVLAFLGFAGFWVP